MTLIYSMDKKALIGLALGFLPLALGTAGIATPSWLYIHFDNLTWREGLWTVCGGDLCIPFATVTSYMIVTRTAELFGLCLMVVAMLCTALKLTWMKHHVKLRAAAAILMSFAGIFMIIGNFIYATKVRDERDRHQMYSFYTGFYLTITASLTVIVTGVLSLLLETLTTEYDVLGNIGSTESHIPGLSANLHVTPI